MTLKHGNICDYCFLLFYIIQLSNLNQQTIEGFILSRQSYDHLGRAQVRLWIRSNLDPIELRFEGQQAIFFVKVEDSSDVERFLNQSTLKFEYKAVSLKTFKHASVVAYYFQSLADYFDAISLLNSHDIVLYESDIRLHDRLLTERFIYGSICCFGKISVSSGRMTMLNPQIKSSNFQPQLKMCSIDIECSVNNELFSIGCYGHHERHGSIIEQGCVFMIAGKDYPKRNTSTDIRWVDDETSLLIAFIRYIKTVDPDVLIGWNVINFDCKVLCQRAKQLGVVLSIGRDGSTMRWRQSKVDGNLSFVNIAGRTVVDGIDALKNKTYSFASFSLENVANELLGRGKLAENPHDRLQEILDNFAHDKEQLAAYNLEDCKLVWDIFHKTQVMDFLVFRSQLTGLPIEKLGGSVASFTNLYLPKLHRQGYVAPNLPADGGLASPGGYVMDSKPGLYQHVLFLDYKSLYPSIIRTFKIDPLGLVEGLKNPDDSIAGFKGAFFDRKKHFLPEIITQLWAQRDVAKQENDQAKSQAIKILMNSFYGVLGSGGCRFYDTRLASSITLRGHEIMQQSKAWIEDEGYQVIYGDTDSTFVWLEGDYQHEQAQAIGEYLAETINRNWQKKLTQEFGLESQLEMEFENHYFKFLMPTIRGADTGSKKRYAGLVRRGDGCDDQWVFKGLESVRTDWTELAKVFQLELYRRVFNEQDVVQYIQDLVGKVRRGDYDALLVYRKRLRQKLSAYKKNIPPQVKAAKLADEQNKKLGRSLQYQNKGWIRYVITVAGPEPLEFQQNTLNYQHYIDKQIQPIADAILPFIGLSFAKIVDKQLQLF